MRRLGWSAVMVVVLAGVLFSPVAVFGQGPEFGEVCHFVDDPEPGEAEWKLIEVPEFTIDLHMSHGDGVPGGEVPDTDGTFAFDEGCVPQSASPVLYAVAWTDVDGDHIYTEGKDTVIAKVEDGPPPADDGVLGVGDLVITEQYPIDYQSFGRFQRTTQPVTWVNPNQCIQLETENGTFSWTHKPGFRETYLESSGSPSTTSWFSDGHHLRMSHEMSASTGSPSLPDTPVTFNDSDTGGGNDSFLDIWTECS